MRVIISSSTVYSIVFIIQCVSKKKKKNMAEWRPERIHFFITVDGNLFYVCNKNIVIKKKKRKKAKLTIIAFNHYHHVISNAPHFSLQIIIIMYETRKSTL